MASARFDWHKSPLSPATRIDAGYRSTQNVRRFFRAHAGAEFHFSRDFMKWMKANVGKTLKDALAEWKRRGEI